MARTISMRTPDGGQSSITVERKDDGNVFLTFMRPGSPTSIVAISEAVGRQLVEDLQSELSLDAGET